MRLLDVLSVGNVVTFQKKRMYKFDVGSRWTESTKYWHLGPVDLYAELKEELFSKRCTTRRAEGHLLYKVSATNSAK